MNGFGDAGPGRSVEWYTPAYLFAALDCTFDLDPCAGPQSACPALEHWGPEVDGLAREWTGLVFCNPPYGKGLSSWMEKLYAHGNGIALVFTRTDTAWFQDHPADAMYLIRKRIAFISGETGLPGKNTGAPSMFLGWGPRAVAVLSRLHERLPGQLYVRAGDRA